ncbi:MAG: large-conductance mechanosensitive channel protein MscL [Chloroflexi bacterium]|nr:large-conductance mechanosensitive channel protein MscL [Chloroflexota bacterium]
MIKEFKEFVIRGNVLDMAVGIIIGSAFGTIIKSLVADVLMPPIGLFLGGVDFSNLFITLKQGTTVGPYETLALAQNAGAVTINYGLFFNALVSFFIIAFAIFILVRSVNRLKKDKDTSPAKPTDKECPYCFTTIPIKAVRCPHCTSKL